MGVIVTTAKSNLGSTEYLLVGHSWLGQKMCKSPLAMLRQQIQGEKLTKEEIAEEHKDVSDVLLSFDF